MLRSARHNRAFALITTVLLPPSTHHPVKRSVVPVPVVLLRVAAAWPLPGLGLLALPDGPAPRLAAYPLHAALAVAVALPGGAHHPATATVEEITRPDATDAPVRGLLLDVGPGVVPPPGTKIWLVGGAAGVGETA